MFTTQQMIERRTRERTFTQAVDFHFQGEPRALRIWDESLVSAVLLVLSVDQLGRLPVALRSQSPEFAAQVQALIMELWSPTRAERLVVPGSLADAPRHARHSKNNQVAETIEKLRSVNRRGILTPYRRATLALTYIW